MTNMPVIRHVGELGNVIPVSNCATSDLIGMTNNQFRLSVTWNLAKSRVKTC